MTTTRDDQGRSDQGCGDQGASTGGEGQGWADEAPTIPLPRVPLPVERAMVAGPLGDRADRHRGSHGPRWARWWARCWLAVLAFLGSIRSGVVRAVRAVWRGAGAGCRAVGRGMVRAGRAVWTAVLWVVRHRVSGIVFRWLLRNLCLYPALGLWTVLGRVYDRVTLRTRMMRAAEAAGDVAGLQAWADRDERVRAMRHKRRMDRLRDPFAIPKRAAAALGTVVVGLLLVGVLCAVSFGDASWILTPITSAVHVVAWLVWLVGEVWYPITVAAPWALLVWVWHVGRTGGQVPRWAAPVVEREHPTVILTPGGIAEALAHLGIGPLNRAIKEGWTVTFATPPVRVGTRGYFACFSLPMGVTPDMIADRRDVLARNLVRAPLEVWPTAADQAGYVDLWVADQGATEKPAPAYPLLHDGTADVFAGIPIGVSQRGDVVVIELPGGNVVFGGIMGSGKSNAARVTMLGAALDPLCELWVFVFANNGDFDAYTRRLARYRRGVDDDIAASALTALRDLYAEVARRESRLAELGAKKVTRTLAERHPDLRPLVALFSECHELFGHPEYGREAADLAVQTLRRARKTAITLGFDTQSSRADAIPPKIVELVKINACFAVKSWRSNDGFLGDGSFAAGIRATELRPGKDTGTSLVTGATAERFEIVKWFYIEADDDTGFDAAADVIARSLESVHPEVSRPIDGEVIEPAAEVRDLLDDLNAVLGRERVPVADVPALLRGLAPHWAPYRSLTGVQLRTLLRDEHGIRVPSTGNTWPLDPAAVRARIAERAAHQGAETGGAEARGS